MRIAGTEFPGLFVVTPQVFEDARGFFMESWSRNAFAGQGLDYDWVQDNHALSVSRGVLRGLHFQIPPSQQTKLVRVTRGAVYDVVVDLRRGAPSYGRWFGLELSADNRLQLLIPAGFAHGYQTLGDVTEFQYKVDAAYDPACDKGIFWADPDLDISWPLAGPVLSDKDKGLPRLAEFDSPFVFAG